MSYTKWSDTTYFKNISVSIANHRDRALKHCCQRRAAVCLVVCIELIYQVEAKHKGAHLKFVPQ